jgi:hypothetical protein
MQPNHIAQMREDTAMSRKPSNDGSDNRGLAEAVARRANIKMPGVGDTSSSPTKLHLRWILPLR